jgi:hypothetical protein
MGEVRDGDPSRFDGYERSVEIQTILEIAEALRKEFGVGIDAHPGGKGNEAGAINRAFRAAARRILQTIATPREEMPLVLTWVLRHAALRRLTELGLSEEQAECLLDSEPGLGDRWSAYMALAPAAVISDAGGDQGTGKRHVRSPRGDDLRRES